MDTQSPVADHAPVPGAAPATAGLADVAVLLLREQAAGRGGLPGLEAAFAREGLADRFGSWVRPGPNLPVSVSVTGSSNPSCLGEQVIYTATPVNGGFNPLYDWKVNGISQGITSPTFSFTPVNGFNVECKLVSNAWLSKSEL